MRSICSKIGFIPKVSNANATFKNLNFISAINRLILRLNNQTIMTVLLLGSGGREHALAWKIIQSQKCTQLFVAPGNAGTALVASNIDISPTDFDSIKAFVIRESVDMVVVGPEDPLVKGIYDFFKNDDALREIPVIGPSKNGAQLEGSKEFAKQFLMRHNIPT